MFLSSWTFNQFQSHIDPTPSFGSQKALAYQTCPEIAGWPLFPGEVCGQAFLPYVKKAATDSETTSAQLVTSCLRANAQLSETIA